MSGSPGMPSFRSSCPAVSGCSRANSRIFARSRIAGAAGSCYVQMTWIADPELNVVAAGECSLDKEAQGILAIINVHRRPAQAWFIEQNFLLEGMAQTCIVVQMGLATRYAKAGQANLLLVIKGT